MYLEFVSLFIPENLKALKVRISFVKFNYDIHLSFLFML
jgi:hypothetical protein